MRCAICGNTKELTIEGIDICKKCYESDKTSCNECDREILMTFSRQLNHHYYCLRCFEQLYFICRRCMDYFERSDHDSYNIGGREGEYCESCYECLAENSSSRCYVCNSSANKDCSSCGHYFCDNCWSFHTHDVKFLEGTKKGFITIPRFVGLEIEVEKGNIKKLQDSLNRSNSLTHDGSLDNTGLEVLTPPCSLDLFEKQVNKTCDSLIKSGYKATVQCGLHVHIDGRKIVKDSKRIIQLVQTIYAVEDMIFSMIPPSRWTSKYCQPLSYFYQFKNFDGKAKIDALESVWYKTENMREKRDRKHHKYDNTRYAGFNLHSLFYRGTVEFRYHSGTINPNKILMWTEMLLKIFDYAMERYDPKQITELFDMQTSGDKLYVMSKTFDFSDQVYGYMKGRIRKFNPDYAVRFNKGKQEREETEAKNSLYRKSLSKKFKSLNLRIDKLDKKLRKKTYPTDGMHYVSFSDIASEISPQFTERQRERLIITSQFYGNSISTSDLERAIRSGEQPKAPENKLEIKREKLIHEAGAIEQKLYALGRDNQEGFLKRDEVSTLSQMLKKGFSMKQESEVENEEGEEMKMREENYG